MVQLQNTVTMRHILVELCKHPKKHDLYEGFRMLEPWDIFADEKNMEKLLHHYINTENTEFWAGKNVYSWDLEEKSSDKNVKEP